MRKFSFIDKQYLNTQNLDLVSDNVTGYGQWANLTDHNKPVP